MAGIAASANKSIERISVTGVATLADARADELSFITSESFAEQLAVYGREGLPCPRCGRALKQAVIGQRASVWCASCQR